MNGIVTAFTIRLRESLSRNAKTRSAMDCLMVRDAAEEIEILESEERE